MRASGVLFVAWLAGVHGFAPAASLRLPARRSSCSVAALKPARLPHTSPSVIMSEASGKKSGGLPFFLDLGTKGGIVFYSITGIVLPWVAYSYMLDVLNYDIVFAGNVILVGYVGLLTVLWTARCGPAIPRSRAGASTGLRLIGLPCSATAASRALVAAAAASSAACSRC